MEEYRSGHNGPDSKSGRRQRLVGSNPTSSAKRRHLKTGAFSLLPKRKGTALEHPKPFLCPLFFCLLASHNQLSQLLRSDFKCHLQRGEMSDQALLADEHLSADHRTDEGFFCHMAVQCSDRYAGQFGCQLARQGVGVMSPSLLQIFTQCFRFAGRQHDVWRCRRGFLRRKSPGRGQQTA